MKRSRFVRAIIFDFDGVLVVSERLHYQAFAQALEELGGRLSWEEYEAEFIGVPDKVTAERSLVKNRLDATDEMVKRLLSRKTEIFDASLPDGVTPAQDLTTVIRTLADSYTLAIASGAFRHQIIPVLEHHGIRDAFVAIIGQDDVRRGKPDPEPYLLAWKQIRDAVKEEVAPQQCLVVEDALPGLEAARAAGMLSVAIATYYSASSFPQGQIVLSCLKDLLSDEVWDRIDTAIARGRL